MPATKSALRGSQAAATATTCALQGSQSAVPATKSALRGSQSAAPATKSARRESALRGSQRAVAATNSANEPHVQKSRLTAPVTKSERLEDHRHVQSAAPATKSAFRSKAAPIPKSILDHKNTRFPLCLPRKVTTMFENAHGTADKQILRACAVEMHLEDFERHECIVNSGELAGHVGATPRLDTGA